jgi:carbon catabolite-derepressing protein kinase
VITTPNDVVMVMEYAGEELFTYIVETGKGGVSHICDADRHRPHCPGADL